MHPGHSICVPLPSSQHDFTVRIIFRMRINFFLLKKDWAFLARIKYKGAFGQVQTPFKRLFWFAPSLRDWREKGAPTRTYPDQREQSWASIYTCLPLGPQSNGSGGHFTQEKQIVEKNNINKKGKCPNPLLSFTTVVSQTFFIIIMIIVYIFSIKSMLMFFFFNFFCLFL